MMRGLFACQVDILVAREVLPAPGMHADAGDLPVHVGRNDELQVAKDVLEDDRLVLRVGRGADGKIQVPADRSAMLGEIAVVTPLITGQPGNEFTVSEIDGGILDAGRESPVDRLSFRSGLIAL